MKSEYEKNRSLYRHTKTPSLRDLMLGKKIVKKLDENFFEKVLDLELKIKRDFDLNSLQQLVTCYSNAIEYYESNEDIRFKDYENRLNSLLSQPEILKKMRQNQINPSNSNPFNSKKEVIRFILLFLSL